MNAFHTQEALMSFGAPLKKRTLLVVEDDHGSRLLIKHLLMKLNIDVVDAETGEEALELIKEQPIEGMLLDIALGTGINGLDLGARIKTDKRFSDLPMVAVTTYDKNRLQDMEEKGFTGYLQKPYSAAELRTMLSEQSLRKKAHKLIL